MKILYITDARLPTEKAHGYQIFKTCEALSAKGAEVSLIVPDRQNEITEDPFSFYGTERIFSFKKIPYFWANRCELAVRAETLFFPPRAMH